MNLDFRKFMLLLRGLSHCEGSAFIWAITDEERAREEAREKIAQQQGRQRPQIVTEMSPDELKRLYNASDSRSSNTDSS